MNKKNCMANLDSWPLVQVISIGLVQFPAVLAQFLRIGRQENHIIVLAKLQCRIPYGEDCMTGPENVCVGGYRSP